MTKKQRKDHDKNMKEQAEANDIAEENKRQAKQFKTYIEIRREIGSSCFP